MGCSFMRTVPFKLPVGKPLERSQDRSQEALPPSPGQKGLAGARVRVRARARVIRGDPRMAGARPAPGDASLAAGSSSPPHWRTRPFLSRPARPHPLGAAGVDGSRAC